MAGKHREHVAALNHGGKLAVVIVAGARELAEHAVIGVFGGKTVVFALVINMRVRVGRPVILFFKRFVDLRYDDVLEDEGVYLFAVLAFDFGRGLFVPFHLIFGNVRVVALAVVIAGIEHPEVELQLVAR